jgi:2-dehydropantoate 2-reductase
VAIVSVIGAGGVGGLLGAMLARGGHEVRLLARGAALEAIRSRGLRVTGPEGEPLALRLAVSDDPSAIGPVDMVLVATKTWQVPGVARRLGPLVGGSTAVVPLQNGVEAAEQLEAHLDANHVLGGLCHMLSWAEQPGEIRWMGARPSVTLGARRAGQTAAVDACAAALRSGGVDVEVTGSIEPALWSKLLFIAPFGAVGAVEQAPAGALRADARSRARLEASMVEVSAVAAARGVALAPDTVANAMRRIDSLPADARASMHRDVLAGRPSEVHELIGAVVRLGRAAGVEVPVSAELYASLLPLERRAREEAGLGGEG